MALHNTRISHVVLTRASSPGAGPPRPPALTPCPSHRTREAGLLMCNRRSSAGAVRKAGRPNGARMSASDCLRPPAPSHSHQLLDRELLQRTTVIAVEFRGRGAGAPSTTWRKRSKSFRHGARPVQTLPHPVKALPPGRPPVRFRGQRRRRARASLGEHTRCAAAELAMTARASRPERFESV